MSDLSLPNSPRIHTSGTVSELTMTPSSEEDFGTVLCTSYNEIGRQVEPCLFDLIPIGKQELFLSFSAPNRTGFNPSSLCSLGYPVALLNKCFPGKVMGLSEKLI